MKTVLFVGAGRHQRRAIARAKELGLRVAAIDRNPDAPGLALADTAEVVEFDQAVDAARRLRPDGVLTIASDRAVPVVAEIAETLDLPGIGRQAARNATNKIAMRHVLGRTAVPQPRWAAARSMGDGVKAASSSIGFPAVVKPADSAGQRGISVVRSLGDAAPGLKTALEASTAHEAIVEQFVDGVEVNCLAVARAGEVDIVTLSDRLRGDGAGFGVCLMHLYPSVLDDSLRTNVEEIARASVQAVGLRDAVAYPQLLVSADGVRVVEIAARVPGGQMDEVARLGAGVDLVEVALRQALGEAIPDGLVRPRLRQPLAIRFLTAEPGPLPTGVVTSVDGVERAAAAPGVVEARSVIVPGETIRPVQTDGDRRGYVIALGETREEAVARADAAAALVEVEIEVA